jgi:hypothetical protein
LDAAHAKGLVHRDVKPSNVLLDESEHVYLADFGLTRRLEDEGGLAAEGRSVGTPSYLAPEQIEGKPVDGRADVYALGCVLFECLTGKVPFSRGSRLATAWAHLEEEPPKASGVKPELPESVDEVLRRALAKEPGERYPTCNALIEASGEALGIRRATPVPRRRLLLVAAAGVLVVLAIALAVALRVDAWSSPRPAPLFGEPNTVVRIDPGTNEVSAVVDVGGSPQAIVANQRTVWVYNEGDATISEVDAATATVLGTTALSAKPISLSWWDGPILAADADGAWVIGVNARGDYRLTRILSGARGKTSYALDYAPRAVATGEDAVWVLGRGAHDVVLRVDPATGRVTSRTVLPTSSSATSLGVGAGSLWVVALSRSKVDLYRIDARSGRRTGTRALPGYTRPPRVAYGSVWIYVTQGGGDVYRIDPRTLWDGGPIDGLSPAESSEVAGGGSLWLLDIPTGAVARIAPETGLPVASIQITRVGPKFYGPARPTAIAAGRGSVWVTVAEGYPTTSP